MRHPGRIKLDLDLIDRLAQGLRGDYALAYKVTHERGKGESVRISGSHDRDEVLDVVIQKENQRKAVGAADIAIERAYAALQEASNELARVVGHPHGEKTRDRAKLITDRELKEAQRNAASRRERGEQYGS